MMYSRKAKEGKVVSKFAKGVIFTLVLIYVIAPDLFPGPIDDSVIIFAGLCAAFGKEVLDELECDDDEEPEGGVQHG